MKLRHKSRALIESIRANFVFRSRPEPLPAEMRPDWRISTLLLSLRRCGRDGKMSLKKAHVINWAVLSDNGRARLSRMLSGERELEDVVVRFDPAFNRALEFAAAEGLVELNKKTTGLVVQLSDKGERLAILLEDQKDCLVAEKSFFAAIKRVSEDRVEELLGWQSS